jgi:imidazoleglycerol-phosphate dehydratase
MAKGTAARKAKRATRAGTAATAAAAAVHAAGEAAAAREATIARKTSETDITVRLGLDGRGRADVRTPFAFLDHMLGALAKHGLFDLTLRASGDVEVDGHHTVEDVGICLGLAFRDALGDKAGLVRFGHAVVPLDEALAEVTIDFSGRAAFFWRVTLPPGRVGDFDPTLARELFGGFAAKAECNLHVDLRHAENVHHALEAIFKAFARAAEQGARVEPRRRGEVPSTKGTLTK